MSGGILYHIPRGNVELSAGLWDMTRASLAMRRTLCVPASRSEVKSRRLFSHDPMATLCARGVLNSRQNSTP